VLCRAVANGERSCMADRRGIAGGLGAETAVEAGAEPRMGFGLRVVRLTCN
jgi:hypothetical protein